MGLELGSETRRKIAAALEPAVSAAGIWFRESVDIDRALFEPVARRLTDALNKRKTKATWLTADLLRGFCEEQIEEIVATLDLHGSRHTFGEVYDAQAAAECLASSLDTLPWSYTLLLPTPITTNRGPASRPLDPAGNYRLVRYSPEESAKFTLHEPDESRASYYHQEFPEYLSTEQYYFAADISGYVRYAETTPAIDEFVHAFKGILGLLVVERSIMPSITAHGAPPRAIPMIIQRRTDDGEARLIPYKWLSIDDTLVVSRLEMRRRNRDDDSDPIAAIVPAFADAATRSSARWYLDSFAETKGLLQIVQAAIALEILLGDREEAELVGIGALLGNRLAYMVGQTPSDRRRVLSEFKKLYDIRSRIVHSGKATLNDEERDALSRLQDFAQRALHEQIYGLKQEHDWEVGRQQEHPPAG